MTGGPGESFLCQVCVDDRGGWVALAPLSPTCVLAEPVFQGFSQGNVGRAHVLPHPLFFPSSLLCVEQITREAWQTHPVLFTLKSHQNCQGTCISKLPVIPNVAVRGVCA